MEELVELLKKSELKYPSYTEQSISVYTDKRVTIQAWDHTFTLIECNSLDELRTHLNE